MIDPAPEDFDALPRPDENNHPGVDDEILDEKEDAGPAIEEDKEDREDGRLPSPDEARD